MTLSERNAFFKAGIVFCSVITLLTILASLLTMPVYPLTEENSRRPMNFFRILTGWFLENNYYAVHVSLILTVLFTLTGIFLIHSFFERTSAPEIIYISFFTISFSFEIIRLILPLHLIYIFPSFYILIAFRLLLFARFFGLFSLFTASVCAAGLEAQKTRNIIMILTIAVVVVVYAVPIDIHSWDTGLNMVIGYSSFFRMIEGIVLIITSVTFFAAAKVRGSREYIFAGIGVALALTGRNMLLGTDSWAGTVAGIIFLSFGTWLICSKLHKIHLWL
jgi:hypothetical protein